VKLSDLMTTDVITVGPDAPLKEAARRMVEAGVSGLPVTDESGVLIGVITEADFVASEAGRRAPRRAGLLRHWLKEEKTLPAAQNVGDVMTKEVTTLNAEADHAEAARTMQKAGIKRIPVVDGEGALKGIISRSDILRAFTRSDSEIISEIEDHVMTEILWIDSSLVDVTCEDGNVALNGRLETRSDAQLLAELTNRLDGVASVDNNLTWSYDNTKLEVTQPRPGLTNW
jgi:CBS domain-containing protein